jgi:hypothetical protein
MRRLLVHCFIGLSIGFYVGCESDEDEASKEQQLCERLWECGLMTGGYSVQDCTDIILQCTDQLLTSERTDWNNDANACLGYANCGNFEECLPGLFAVCPLDGSGSSDGTDGGECVETGGVCEAHADCCDYPETAQCVDFTEEYGVHCAANCTQNSDCTSNCCAETGDGSFVCAPDVFCG